MIFDGLPQGHFRAILADPPWHFQSWAGGRFNGDPKPTYTPSRAPDYATMREPELTALPVDKLAAPDCVLFLWMCWPVLEWSLRTVKAWGFEYKTCGFCWVKGHAQQLEMFRDDIDPHMSLGYWTRSNSEICLLATKGAPKRKGTDVKQAIVEPRREHSRKPDCVHERIERLVDGPYLELFARKTRPGWISWGDQVGKFR
jgi:N6-adenosine-specific RNA methylase IME4